MDLTERIIRTCAQVGCRAGLTAQVSSTGSLVACHLPAFAQAARWPWCGHTLWQPILRLARRPGSTQPPACASLPLHRQAVCGQLQLPYQGQVLDFEKPFARKTMHELVQEKTGVDFEQFGSDLEVGGPVGRVGGRAGAVGRHTSWGDRCGCWVCKAWPNCQGINACKRMAHQHASVVTPFLAGGAGSGAGGAAPAPGHAPGAGGCGQGALR